MYAILPMVGSTSSRPEDAGGRTVAGLTELIARGAQGDPDALSNCAFYFETLRCEAGLTAFPDAVFDQMVNLMQDSGFLAEKNAWKILKLLENGWDLTTNEQRRTLLLTIETASPQFQHWMGPFFLSELLGSAYCDAAALAVVERLYGTSSDMARQFLPHALEYIAKAASAQTLRDRALEKLRWIAATASGSLKKEADAALARLRYS